MTPKQPTFTIQYTLNTLYDAHIKADSLEDALHIAKNMSVKELNNAPGEVLDETLEITAVIK